MRVARLGYNSKTNTKMKYIIATCGLFWEYIREIVHQYSHNRMKEKNHTTLKRHIRNIWENSTAFYNIISQKIGWKEPTLQRTYTRKLQLVLRQETEHVPSKTWTSKGCLLPSIPFSATLDNRYDKQKKIQLY